LLLKIKISIGGIKTLLPLKALCFGQRYKKDLIYANGVFKIGSFGI
jgi:hypothetical protein